MAEVESFTLDHTKVKAPYVRLIEEQAGQNGGTIANYDLRFLQPNQQEMPTGAIHTLEHLLAANLRDRLDGLIDISPFGCRTGFHLISWYTYTPAEVAVALRDTLALIVDDLEWADVPATTAVECGNYRDHSLWGAKEWAKQVLEQGISVNAFEREIV
ncbi:MAG: S-ribosylhomocysteine lyase [Lactobacillaceae bacterium]|jgi:S-ribosylhomocysteine lyase|nr:S-ribosylhomocysteine lyase [Lactobacillaceae bacterium]